jgi:hypothetical protein
VRTTASVLALGAAIAAAVGAAGVLVGEVVLPARSIIPLALLAAVLAATASTGVRAFLRAASRSPLAFAVACTALAWFLSLGPHPTVGGEPRGSSRPLLWLARHVPGFDGLRVPARFAMVAVLFLSWAAAYGVRDLVGRSGRFATAVAGIVASLWMVDAWSAPFPVNLPMASDVAGIASPARRVPLGSHPPPLARRLRSLPPDSVIAAFPFGVQAWDIRHVYESTMHWQRLVNGFSGYAPPWYDELARRLRDPYVEPEAAWHALRATGATHAVVRRQAYLGRLPPAPYGWLEAHGARLVARVGTDEIYALPR